MTDALSEILQTIRLRGGIYFRCELTAPWGMEVPQNPDAEFHVVVNGHCWIGKEGNRGPIPLSPGDVVVFLDGVRHRLLDTPESRAQSAESILGDQSTENFGPIAHGGGGATSTILCGYFRFDGDHSHPLLTALPRFIHLRAAESAGVEALIRLMHQETQLADPGSEAVINRLCEVLFIQILRQHIRDSEAGTGLLTALQDRRICNALAFMHRQPELPWTLDGLASQLGMSRSAFAARFAQLMGQSPMQYLTLWRITLARRLLRETSMTIPVIAERVGYGSEAAFGKVFKKIAGAAPGMYRRQVTLSQPDISSESHPR